ncbi:MAG: hypothetical protein A4E56_00430 [Pelotomaculum sp. PtaU1.Bin065]|nr:MAG: hypothetical protein A4E56_00430 [Pelotomaculum sp. PtaU1.Bin065]
MRKIMVVMFIMAVLSFSAVFVLHYMQPAYAEVASSSESSSSSAAASGGDSGSSSSGIIGKLVELINAVLDLPKKIVDYLLNTMLNIIFSFWGLMIDAALLFWAGVLGAGFIHTTLPGSIDWVRHGNGTIATLCIVISVLFLVVGVIHVFHGKRHWLPLVRTFVIAFLLSFFSVQIVNVLVWLANTASVSIMQGALDGYTAPVGMNLSAGSLSGSQVMTLPFTSNTAIGGTKLLSPLFLDAILPGVSLVPGQQAHGGIIALLIAASGWIMVCFMVVFRILAIILGSILAPVYITMSVWSSEIEPAVGWVALMTRTVFIQLIWAVVWQLMVTIQAQSSIASLFGLTANAVNSIILWAMGIISYLFWAKPTYHQLKAPVTLAGGAVIEKTGKIGEGVGRVVQLVGMATLQPEVVAAGGKITAGGKAVADKGAAMHGGRSMKDALDLSKDQRATPVPNPAAPFVQKIEKKYLEKQKDQEETKKWRKYWTLQDKYIVKDRQTGLPVEVPAPPEGYEYMGEW